jgi:hypothetical protein
MTTIPKYTPAVALLSAFAFAAESPLKPRSKVILPDIMFKPTTRPLVEIHRLSANNPAALLSYLDDQWLDRKVYGTTEPLVRWKDMEDLRSHMRDYALRRLGDVASPDLIPSLEEYVRRYEAAAKPPAGLASYGLNETYLELADRVLYTIERIRYRAQGRDAYVKAMVAWVQTPKPPLTPPLRDLWQFWLKTGEGARALSVLQAVEAVPLLIEKASSSSEPGPYVFALARMEDRRAMEVLRQYVVGCTGGLGSNSLPLEPEQPDPAWAYWRMRTAGMTLQEAIKELIREANQKQYTGAYLRVGEILEYIGQPAVPALIKVLEDPASSECAVLIALGVLTNLRAPEAASAFLGILRRGPHRDMAARGLGWLEAREAFDDLLAAARQEEDFALRLSAIDALKRLGDARAEPLLLELLEHPHSSIRLSAAEALMRVATPAAIPRLRHWLQIEPQVRVRTALRYAIEQASKRDEAR